MITRYRDGRLVRASGDPPADLDGLREGVAARLERFDITGALEAIWQVVRRLNQYVEETAPWQLARDEARSDELELALCNLADGLVAVAVAVAPYLPETAPRILEALRQPPELAWERIRAGTAADGEGIEPAPPLFPRVDAPAPA
jgi:methionyl-tRNA synthetase